MTRSVIEFLDLNSVSSQAIVIHGSGQVSIVTAPRYRPGAAYRILGAASAPQTVAADHQGALHFLIDLGASDTRMASQRAVTT